ncbi:TetR/AcrR family transcriptional regulator [Oscillatoria sp. FACHB-1407]|uniref:TetR/AcrR family transcriptional regulator n=1 Tax=Oscillatoria sp. FACHB-1407 TaxID=2692847 RepID=UPI001683D5E5|nr:TetR/AcrR family transcriptional regulator [Oscillatoria sp. FACHB-1407]MBD2461900.1 TetR/AcrR family transcriptional regulator [Oscillatoria sp. FACHB-1407]
MKADTAQQILDVAEDLVRKRGYSAFSYADISEQVGIRKASIHYHFYSKEELTKALVNRYRDTALQTLNRFEQTTSDLREQLVQFCRLYRHGLDQEQMCLCGILSAEIAILPEPVQRELGHFFVAMEAWLTKVLKRGCETGYLKLRTSPEQEAAFLMATLQGVQLMARTSDDSEATFDRIMNPLLAAMMIHGTPC